MSIYGTWFTIDADHHDLPNCDLCHEASPDCWDFTDKPCSCDAIKKAPTVYRGSHVLPSKDDRHGGHLEVASIPNHITREGRPEGLHDWLRLWVSCEAVTKDEGSEHEAGDAVVLLDRPQVENLRDVLTAWLNRSA